MAEGLLGGYKRLQLVSAQGSRFSAVPCCMDDYKHAIRHKQNVGCSFALVLVVIVPNDLLIETSKPVLVFGCQK